MARGVAIRVNGAPDETATSATAVEVSESVGQPTYFTLEYPFDISDGDFSLLKEGKLGPGSELGVFVSSSDATECWPKDLSTDKRFISHTVVLVPPCESKVAILSSSWIERTKQQPGPI